MFRRSSLWFSKSMETMNVVFCQLVEVWLEQVDRFVCQVKVPAWNKEQPMGKRCAESQSTSGAFSEEKQIKLKGSMWLSDLRTISFAYSLNSADKSEKVIISKSQHTFSDGVSLQCFPPRLGLLMDLFIKGFLTLFGFFCRT